MCYVDDPAMSATHDKEQREVAEHQKHLIPVAWAILVMRLSLATVILLYAWIDHIGPSFSSDVLQNQQQKLRQQYGLPYRPVITDPKVLSIPYKSSIIFALGQYILPFFKCSKHC